MFSMSKLRDKSTIFILVLLFFFVASMTVGGLVGGANIITTIQGFFGKTNTNLYVGKVDNENVSIQQYLTERQKQLGIFRQQGRSIDSRAIQNAGDFAWNTIVDRTIKDKKIKEFNLFVYEDEIFDFLLLTPPQSFQDNLKALGLYKDENNNFILEDFQNDVTFGTLPDTTNQLLFLWENYLKEYLADRKLQNLYNNSVSITEEEIIENYKNNNLNCTIDILSVNTNDINDSLINITDDEILAEYNLNKQEKYKIDERVIVEYVFWENINQSSLDSLDIIDKQDSLLQLSIDFSSEAEINSFNDALEMYNTNVKDTIYITESFLNNSGIPFQMGSIRSAVRFSFDNNIGKTSEQIITDNGIMVFHIINKLGEEFKSIDDVRNNIKRNLLKDKKMEFAKNILADTDYENNDWSNIANNNSIINFNENELSTIGGNFQPIGRSNELAGELIKRENDEISNLLSSFSHAFFIKIRNKDSFNYDTFLEEKDSIRTTLLANKKNQIFNNWLRAEKNRIDIIDLRHKIF